MKKLKGIFSLLILLLVLNPIVFFNVDFKFTNAIHAQANNHFNKQLNIAEEEYKAGNFKYAVELVEKYLAVPNLSNIEKGKSYRLLGLIYLELKSEKEANDAVKNMLINIPNYKTTAELDPLSFQKMINTLAQSLTPEINFITPNSIEDKNDNFTMKISGSNFVYGSQVRFNGAQKLTTFASDSLLLVDISKNDNFTKDEYEVTVYNPVLEGKISNVKKLEVKTSQNTVWKWILVGSAAVAITAAAISLTKPEANSIIADPPDRP